MGELNPNRFPPCASALRNSLSIQGMAPWWGSHLESPKKEKMRAPTGCQTGEKTKREVLDTAKNKLRALASEAKLED